MNKLTSIYLDFLRIIAAFGVVLVHANLYWFSDGQFLHESYGHKLVMVFFVLSGFLVAYTTDAKKKDLPNYFIDRFSRLYSVVVPALIFNYLIDNIGVYFNPEFYESQIAKTGQWWRATLNLSYLQQNWFLCTKPSTNGTFWSIAYEFWYYVLFGIYFYIKNTCKRIVFIIACILFIGVKITLLLPVWAMGVCAYQLAKKYTLNQLIARIGFGISLLFILYFTINSTLSSFEDTFPFGLPPLYFSSRFVFDYWYGFLIATNIYFISQINLKFPFISNENHIIVKIIRNLSSTTFTLYLFHLPLLLFAAAIIPYNHTNIMHLWLIIFAIFLFVWIASIYIEPTRIYYKKVLSLLFRKLALITNEK